MGTLRIEHRSGGFLLARFQVIRGGVLLSLRNLAMNPRFTVFLEKHPKLTVAGLGWAVAWRIYLVIVGVLFTFVAIAAMLTYLFDH